MAFSEEAGPNLDLLVEPGSALLMTILMRGDTSMFS
jgi:hypothetical protein